MYDFGSYAPVCIIYSSLARVAFFLDFSLWPWDRVIWNNLQEAYGPGRLAAAIPGDIVPHAWLVSAFQMYSHCLLRISISNLRDAYPLFPSCLLSRHGHRLRQPPSSTL